MRQRSSPNDLSWLLDDLVDRVGEIRQAVLLSRDGLVMSASRTVGYEEAERLAALSSGLHSLANGVREHFGRRETKQSIVELEDALFFVSAAGSGSCLAVLSDSDGNIGLVGYEMAMLTTRLNKQLSAAARTSSEAPRG
ncbi:roadblock/LC7 domain-containing protein [Actinocorallia populi]|uniref:roadblock/LC7 domain-containing protein n=1 Tax=Actinocorallia populi TaxID=2079200 RepID=UPI000D091825|nr:roadblock/LC7 domain-containing protein [Actinocorallia populi]